VASRLQLPVGAASVENKSDAAVQLTNFVRRYRGKSLSPSYESDKSYEDCPQNMSMTRFVYPRATTASVAARIKAAAVMD
jgi:hypothetical protein